MSVLDDSIQDSAVVSIYTDSYSSREWCRHEVLEAKRMNVPMLMVDCLQTVDERSFPYLGNVPVVRMDPSRACIAEIGQIMGRLLDEVFKGFLWRCRIEGLRKSHPEAHYIAHPPELISVAGLPARVREGERSIVYPDPPLGEEEVQLFAEVAHDVRLHSLGEWLAESGT